MKTQYDENLPCNKKKCDPTTRASCCGCLEYFEYMKKKERKESKSENVSNKIMKFRKKPVIIEAYQTDVPLDIETLEGVMHASPGDWIITGVNGEKYPCKPDIFKKTYEPEKAWEGTDRDKQKSIIEKFSQFEQITGPNMLQCVTISAETVRDVLEVLKMTL